jgi:hypothetical protein
MLLPSSCSIPRFRKDPVPAQVLFGPLAAKRSTPRREEALTWFLLARTILGGVFLPRFGFTIGERAIVVTPPAHASERHRPHCLRQAQNQYTIFHPVRGNIAAMVTAATLAGAGRGLD